MSHPVIAWKARRDEYTDSGNGSFCLISWMGKYFFCLDVPAFIHNCLHFILEKNARSSRRMSVSRAATTIIQMMPIPRLMRRSNSAQGS